MQQLERGAPLGAQIGERLGAERAVDVDTGDAALRSDPVGHQPHHRARAGAHVEAAHARLEPDAVEQLFARPLPHQRLIAQALILSQVPGMDVTVRIGLPRFCRHPPPPHFPSLRYMQNVRLQ